jgi:hypothetical protein
VVSARGLLVAGALAALVAPAWAEDDPPISEIEIPVEVVKAYIATPASAQRTKSLQHCKWWKSETQAKSEPPAMRFGIEVTEQAGVTVTYFDAEGARIGTNTTPARGGSKTEVDGFVRCRVMTTEPQKT